MFYQDVCREIETELDRCHAAFHSSHADEAQAAFSSMLRQLSGWQRRLPSHAWRLCAIPVIRRHALHAVCCEEPFTRRAFTKPRGIPGDAVMMDYLYRRMGQSPEVTTLSRQGSLLYNCIVELPCGKAVRERCRLVAAEIDRCCATNPRAEILSLAAGHLREADLSAALRERCFGRVLAVDQDPQSISEIECAYGALGIQTLLSKLTPFVNLSRNDKLGYFDIIYSAGLFDYLSDKLARRLVTGLLARLRPGGVLLIPNFMPGMSEAHYIEAFCDWWLILRNEQAMLDLLADVPAEWLGACSVSVEATNNIATLRVVRA